MGSVPDTLRDPEASFLLPTNGNALTEIPAATAGSYLSWTPRVANATGTVRRSLLDANDQLSDPVIGEQTLVLRQGILKGDRSAVDLNARDAPFRRCDD